MLKKNIFKNWKKLITFSFEIFSSVFIFLVKSFLGHLRRDFPKNPSFLLLWNLKKIIVQWKWNFFFWKFEKTIRFFFKNFLTILFELSSSYSTYPPVFRPLEQELINRTWGEGSVTIAWQSLSRFMTCKRSWKTKKECLSSLNLLNNRTTQEWYATTSWATQLWTGHTITAIFTHDNQLESMLTFALLSKHVKTDQTFNKPKISTQPETAETMAWVLHSKCTNRQKRKKNRNRTTNHA